MERRNVHGACRAGAFALMFLFSLGVAIRGEAQLSRQQEQRTPVGPGSTIVHSMFGGQIFGFDIDQNGTEGVLSEAQDLGGGKVLAAVETFDQKSGKILNVVSKIQSKDDFLTLGIVGRAWAWWSASTLPEFS